MYLQRDRGNLPVDLQQARVALVIWRYLSTPSIGQNVTCGLLGGNELFKLSNFLVVTIRIREPRLSMLRGQIRNRPRLQIRQSHKKTFSG